MPSFDPEDLIGRTFLLPPEENGERDRAKLTRIVVEIIDQDDGYRLEDIGMDQELFKFRAIIGHQGLLKATHPD